MNNSAEPLVLTLQEVITLQRINLIRIYRVDPEPATGSVALLQQSATWSFGYEFVQLETRVYPIQQVLAFGHTDKILSLYIHMSRTRSKSYVYN
ncbi:hypothetical protein [Spirosoma sp. 209]|uniref:hypothetical protein n=1 Tax=Spirosoma sp. 209 TaxID=1955701 RepID=UPI00098D5234|nr:hypothetical protein [Spirosoma sp. 209]